MEVTVFMQGLITGLVVALLFLTAVSHPKDPPPA